MDQAVAKKTLQELVRREDLKNKICADCSNPNPQWASLRYVGLHPRVPRPSDHTSHSSFAIFLCLQCAGTHRGFGVHVRCADTNQRPLIADVHAARQLCPIGVDGHVAGGSGQTNDCEPCPTSHAKYFLIKLRSLEGTDRF
jgi:hypothetical protein